METVRLVDDADTTSPYVANTASAAGFAGSRRRRSLIGLGALFGLLYFVQGIVDPTDGLLSQPVKSLLRNWGYSAAYAAWFIAILSIAWTSVYFVPLTSERALLLLRLLLPAAVAIAFSDVVIDAMMVTAGQRRGVTGRLQSIQWASMYAAMILTGISGGALSQAGMQQLGFLIAGLSCAVSLFTIWFLVRES